jgi:hypothetical protein
MDGDAVESAVVDTGQYTVVEQRRNHVAIELMVLI